MHIWEESKLFDAFFLKPSVYSSQNICHFSFQKVHSLLFLEITWRRTLHPARSARLTFEWKKGMRVRKWISGEDCYMYNLADTVAYSTEAYLPCGHTSHDNPPLVKAFKGTFHEEFFFSLGHCLSTSWRILGRIIKLYDFRPSSWKYVFILSVWLSVCLWLAKKKRRSYTHREIAPLLRSPRRFAPGRQLSFPAVFPRYLFAKKTLSFII